MKESIFIAKDVIKEYGDYIALNKVSITVDAMKGKGEIKISIST